MRCIAIIPARGGSKGVPDKNIKDINGKALIGYTIEQALECNLFEKVFVNTDSVRIKEVAESFGAEVPFLRPDYLATDSATTLDTVCHAISFYERYVDFEGVFLLQPTSPFRDKKSFDDAYRGLKERGSAVSYSPPREHPSRMRFIESGRVSNVMEEPKSLRRQDLPAVFVRNGAIYAFHKKIPFTKKSLIPKNHYPIIMDEMAGINIDTHFDMKIAEFCFKNPC